MKSFNSKYLENIKIITELQIIKNDPIYIENINLLFYISDLSLFNHPKKVQEYYTELTYNTNDCINILSYLSNKLLEQNMRKKAASIYLNIYSKLNYYRIVNVVHSEIDFEIQTFVKEIKYIETEGEILNYHRIIFPLMYNYMHQTYLYSITDFSDCRLGKLKDNSLIYRFTDISNLEIYYSSIYENKFLSKIEKNRIFLQLYDSLRMTEHNEKFPKSNINNYLNYERINQTEEIIPLDIKSEPIVLLLLQMIENNDFKLLNIFLTMNLDTKTMSFIRTLVLLSLIDILSSDNERTYLLDLDLNAEEVIKGINNYNILDYKIDNEYLNEFYNLINLNYSIDSKKDSNPWSRFHPRLSFKQQTIDTFFSYKGYISDDLKTSETIKTTINSFYKIKKS